MNTRHTDVLILGAGPAGLAAALRLLQLGYHVTLLEKHPFPRPNIGESLTPGIRNILDYLDADSLLEHLPLRPSAVWLAWDSPQEQAADNSVPSVMVDRGHFDQSLLALAHQRGAVCLHNAQAGQISGQPGQWQVSVQHQQQAHTVQAGWILDARGRQAAPSARIATAHPLLALWAECDEPPHPATCVEARPEGWLWGAPLPGGGYRVMACGHPRDIHQFAPGQPEHWLRHLLANSQLLAATATQSFRQAVQACSATPHVAQDAWQPSHLRLGDAAFALDPLSSSGVEKAMRFSLQAATALHTAISQPEQTALAEQFYRERLQQTLLRHKHWTERYYATAWPGSEHGFWQQRRQPYQLPESAGAWAAALNQPAPPEPAEPGQPDQHQLAALLSQQLRLSSAIDYVNELCVVDDRVQQRRALTHPGLTRPVAYVEGQDIVTLLGNLPRSTYLDTLVNHWAHHMPRHTATRLAGWLCRQGVLEIAG